MLSERLQILIDRDQRKRLDAEARRRGTSVGAVVREAIDARFGRSSREEKMRAIAEMRALKPPSRRIEREELKRLMDESHEEEIMRGIAGSTRDRDA